MNRHAGSDRPDDVAESTEVVPSHLFRRQALAQLTSPEQLDHLMQITSARSWLALGALACVVAAGLVWSVAGSVPAEASGQGILLRPPGIYQIQTAGIGTITDLRVRAGDTVRAGQAIATLTAPEGAVTEITSQRDGVILAVLVEQYEFVPPGTTIATVEPLTENRCPFSFSFQSQPAADANGSPGTTPAWTSRS
jgi:hypothetical protein